MNLLKRLPLDAWLPYGLLGGPEPVEPGAAIISAAPGGGAAVFYLLCEGEAEVLWEDEEGRRSLVGSIRAGDGFWGEIGIPGPGGSFVVRASTGGLVLPLDERGFHRLTVDHPELGRLLLRNFRERVRTANGFLEEMRRKRSLLERYAAVAAPYWDIPWIAVSPAMKEIDARIRSLADSPGPVLVEAEYGSGKHLTAVRLHLARAASRLAFISVDGATLSEGSWEEVLFGRASAEGAGERVFGAVELAEGGTLYIRHCDQVPPTAQRALDDMLVSGRYCRLGSTRPRRSGCHVVLSARGDLEDAVARGGVDPGLFSRLAGRRLRIPPLRERKRDIPRLVEYYVARYAAKFASPIDEITPEAMKVLVSYDYRLANVRELEQVIERAVPLPHDRRIRPRHLFLGAPAVPMDRWHFDLLSLPIVRSLVASGRYPAIPQAVATTLFLLVVGVSLIAPAGWAPPARIVWGIWWPLMFVSFYLVGRSWCAVCPYSACARLVRRVLRLELRLPEPVRNHGHLIMAIGLSAVLWVEEVTGMHVSARATGALMAAILLMAVVSGFLFERESWCRYLCPLGGLIGVSAMSSVVEVRSNVDVCRTRCKRSECYHGAGDRPGCPTFEHLLFLDSNQTCTMCLRCVRNCPHESVAFNLRLPGREIWQLNAKRRGMAIFVPLLLGVVLPPMWLGTRGLAASMEGVRGWFTAAHLLVPAGVTALLWLPTLACRVRRGQEAVTRFAMTAYAYVPLAVAAHLAYRMEHALGRETFRYTLESGGALLSRGSVLELVQVAAVVAGGAYATFCLLRVRRNRQTNDFNASAGFWWAHAALIWGYALLVAVLSLR